MFDRLIDFLFPKTCVATKQEWEYLSKDGRRELIPHPEICPASHRFSRDFRTLPWYQKECVLTWIHICFYYGSYLKKLILKLKYYHQKDVVDTLVDRVILSMQTNHSLRTTSKSPSCCFTYVPSHRRRKYMTKGYNQSELLARSLGNKLGIPCVQLVQKNKYTPSQTSLTRQERLLNMLGSFTSIKTSINIYQHIIIVDDIVTTGSTINEIASIIKKHSPNVHIRWLVIGRHNK